MTGERERERRVTWVDPERFCNKEIIEKKKLFTKKCTKKCQSKKMNKKNEQK